MDKVALFDKFAGLAMAALIEKTELMIQATLADGRIVGTPDEFLAKHRAAIATSAYAQAVAMMAEREKWIRSTSDLDGAGTLRSTRRD